MTWRGIALLTILSGTLGVWALIGGAALAIKRGARGKTYDDVDALPPRRVALVLGCARVLRNGSANRFFRYRIEAATRLYRAGKVEHVIVSGDNGRRGYDEPTDMKVALVAMGVPAERVHCDYAGFRTFDSVVRAKEVFGQTELIVVSQRFHNERAIFIAARKGIDAVGFNAREVSRAHSFRTRGRELLARVKTVADLYVLRTRPRFLGEPVQIGTTPQDAK